MTTPADKTNETEAEHWRDTQWDLDFRACVAAVLSGKTRDADPIGTMSMEGVNHSYAMVIEMAAALADHMRAKRSKRPIGVPEPEIRKQHRLLVEAVKEVQEVFQRREMQACPIPIALSRVLDELFAELNEKKKKES